VYASSETWAEVQHIEKPRRQEGVEKDSGEGETTNSEAEMTLNASSAISRFFSSMRSKKIPDHRLIARARVG
jgi:hypothetical protein